MIIEKAFDFSFKVTMSMVLWEVRNRPCRNLRIQACVFIFIYIIKTHIHLFLLINLLISLSEILALFSFYTWLVE